MASLSPPFILCPLPDRKSLLGIRPDRTPNKEIITLGRNIAIRYHGLEQKQECSWTTSRYWFTSPVTFCSDYGKYGAVLNHNIIALWDEDDSSLTNMNKLKLPEHIFALRSSQNGRTVVVMKNGHVAYLSDISEDKTRVKTGSLKEGETLVDFDIDEKNGHCYLASRQTDSKNELTISITGIEKDDSSLKTCTVKLDKLDILGFCISATEGDSFLAYSTYNRISSDGFMYKRNLSKEMEDVDCLKLGNLNKSISKKNPVVMCPLSDNSCIAMYGSDPSEEGAVAVIYDIHYDLAVSKQCLKLYSIPPLMEKIGQSLFVPLGLHILVLTFRVTKSLLSSVVGKHQARLDAEVFEGRDPWSTKGWDLNSSVLEEFEKDSNHSSSTKPNVDEIKETYTVIWETIQQVQILESEGQPESVICNHVIPAALEKNNGAALNYFLDTFLDIPEVHLVSMIVNALKDVSGRSDFVMNEMVNKLLLRKFDKNILVASLRHVMYDDIKKLISYINNLMSNHWQFDFDQEDEYPMKAWLNWCSALVAHYTKFVLHNDTSIIQNMIDSVTECAQVMKSVEHIEPFLLMTYSKTVFEPALNTHNRWRTETVVFE